MANIDPRAQSVTVLWAGWRVCVCVFGGENDSLFLCTGASLCTWPFALAFVERSTTVSLVPPGGAVHIGRAAAAAGSGLELGERVQR